MPSTIPTPVAAALGIVPTVIDTARRVPGRIVQLPILAVTQALTQWAVAQQRYDDLAKRGERLVSQLRGEVSEKDVDEWLAEPIQSLVVDDEPDAVAQVTALLDRAAARKNTPVSAEALEVVEEVVAATPHVEVKHADLPLPDYDHMTLGSLRGRLRSLSLEDLVAVRDYETAHANRLPVVTLVENRLAKLALETTEAPTELAPVEVVAEAIADAAAPLEAAAPTPAKKAPAKKAAKKTS